MKIELVDLLRVLHEQRGKNVALAIAETFGISRQAASARLSRLKADNVIFSAGKGKAISYYIRHKVDVCHTYDIKDLDEDFVWRDQCLPIVRDLPANLIDIWQYGITEMVNNAIDHSEAKQVTICMRRNDLFSACKISDSGIGIFAKIQNAMGLYDKREAILELAKGKFTTDPANHSGEGIFFSSKMFDHYTIRSDELCFIHLDNNGLDVMLIDRPLTHGTEVDMVLFNDSLHTSKEVFDRFSAPEEYTFAKTIVPVKLAQHEGESLISRSQAKRLTRRFERFKTVLLDFADVATIGQAFADEVFRVFATANPDIDMIPENMTAAVAAMVSRARNHS